ncbi:hypothetical protein ACFL6M_07880, partial [Candidatus Eisenbacteria bacterium]
MREDDQIRRGNLSLPACVTMILLLTIGSGIAYGQDGTTFGDRSEGEILFARTPAPSPDGSSIAFSYQGDIWVVPREGGEARRLTVHPAYDAIPIWSPDGRHIAFRSDRDGNQDVYVIPMEGGRIFRLTWHNDYDMPTGWTPDSKSVILQTSRHVFDRGNWAAFAVPLEGGTPSAVLPTGARSSVISPDGRRMAYVRGSVYWWRRGYEGSGRYRLWLYEMEEPLGSVGGRNTGPRLSETPEGKIQREPADWDSPLCTNPGMLRDLALRPEGRHFNLTDMGSVTSLPTGGDPRQGFLADYLSETPDFD